MNRKVSSILLIAFVIAAATSYVVYRVTQNQLRRSAQSAPISIPIVVAVRDLQIGTLIRDVDLTTAEWVGTPPKGALVNKDAALGRGVVSQIYQGEPVLETRLAAAGSGGGLAATIPPGMRACAVRVDDVVGVAGFVLPGMRVDVLVSGTAPGTTNQGPKVKTLLQNIQVLSAGSNIQKDAEGKPVQVPVVNLLVTPEQAELLSLASNQTKIQLVLRNPLDTDTPETPAFFASNLFSESGAPKPPERPVVPVKKPAAAPPPPPAPVAKPPEPTIYLIEILNGAKRSEEKFKDSEQQQPQQ
ncbi:MAG TPA: Flp pilus assembly protein CpaB [Bryobacteraceae bacterium]